MMSITRKSWLCAVLLSTVASFGVNAETNVEIYSNGYSATAVDVSLGGYNYSNAEYTKLKDPSDGKLTSFTKLVRDKDNWFALSFKRDEASEDGLLAVLNAVILGDGSKLADLRFASEENMSKGKLLSLLAPNSPVYNYVSYCMKGDYKARYDIKDGVLASELKLGRDVSAAFDFDLLNRRIIRIKHSESKCDKSLLDFKKSGDLFEPPALELMSLKQTFSNN